ncbi:MAG: lysophospholipid acyltransferase family protein [Ktedonobacterales bacterium]
MPSSNDGDASLAQRKQTYGMIPLVGAMPVYRVLRAVIRIMLPLQMRLHVIGEEHVPKAGPALLVSNHLGPLDPLVIGVRLRRKLRILAKAELFEWPIIGGLARWCQVVPIRRGERDLVALAALERDVLHGHCILEFPEGTYPLPPHLAALLPFKTGAALLAAQMRVPVMPVAIWGSEHVWLPQRGWRPWHRPAVCVQFGEPYYPQFPASLSAPDALQPIADEMARRICALLPARYHGVYRSA